MNVASFIPFICFFVLLGIFLSLKKNLLEKVKKIETDTEKLKQRIRLLESAHNEKKEKVCDNPAHSEPIDQQKEAIPPPIIKEKDSLTEDSKLSEPVAIKKEVIQPPITREDTPTSPPIHKREFQQEGEPRRGNFPYRKHLIDWLEKASLLPPPSSGSNAVAWWSTRIGLALGIIAAVFFGLYVSANTVPWVPLLELFGVAVALFVGGLWFERKISVFGQALSTGGLALLYVTAYASYGLPAMKVIDSPFFATILQLVATSLLIAWALFRKKEAIFSLGLLLGYITTWFASSEGLAPIPLISLLVLSTMAAIVFAWKAWFSALVVGLGGTGIGLFLLAITKWQGSSRPLDSVILTTIVLWTLFWATSFWYLQLKNGLGAELIRKCFPASLAFIAAVGASIIWQPGGSMEPFYICFTIIFLGLGALWWKQFQDVILVQILWAKASFFLALYFVSAFEGPTRAFALLAQSASLLWLASKQKWKPYKIGTIIAWLVGFCFALETIGISKDVTFANLESIHWFFLLFTALSYGLIIISKAVLKLEIDVQDKTRQFFTVTLAAFILMGIVWRYQCNMGALIALVSALIFICGNYWGKSRWPEYTPAICVLGAVINLTQNYGIGSIWPSVVWLASGWLFCHWLGIENSKLRRLLSLTTLLSWVWVGALLMQELPHSNWLSIIWLGIAILWQWLDGRIKVHNLAPASLAPVLAGSTYVFFSEQSEWSNTTMTLLMIIYWVLGWRTRRNSAEKTTKQYQFICGAQVVLMALLVAKEIISRLDNLEASDGMKALCAGLLAVAFMALWIMSRESPLAWIGSLLAVGVALSTLVFTSPYEAGWQYALTAFYFLIIVGSGLTLIFCKGQLLLAQPKVASVFYGGIAILLSLVGFSTSPLTKEWGTASWAAASVLLILSGFLARLRGYRIAGLVGLVCAILRLFISDIQDTLWRIVAFAITSALLVMIGYLYNRFQKKIDQGNLDY